MKKVFLLASLFVSVGLFAQKIEQAFTTKIQQYKPTNEYVVDSYISPEGSRSIFLTPSRFYVIDNSSGDFIVNKELKIKSLQSVEAPVTDFILKEGSGFAVVNNARFVILLDWAMIGQSIEVFDMENGRSLWSSDEFEFTNTGSEMAEEVLVDAAAGMIAANSSLSATKTRQPGLRQDRFFTSSAGPFVSEKADKLIIPVEGRSVFLLNCEEGVHLLSLETGEKKWTFSEFPIVVGAYKFIEKANSILLSNENDAVTGENSSKKTTILLDLSNGSELWRFEANDPIRSDYIRVVENLVVFDFENFTAVDLQTGRVVVRSHVSREGNQVSNFISSQNEASTMRQIIPGLNSLVSFPMVYTGYIKSGKYTYATSTRPSFGSKITIAAFNLKTGEKVWEAENVADAITEITAVTDDYVVVKREGLGKHSWIILSKQTGEKIQELNVDKGETVWTEDRVFHAAKKSVEVYDLSSGMDLLAEIDYKNLEVGDIQNLIPTADGLIVGVAEEGIAWIDTDGKVLQEEVTDKVEGFVIDEDKVVVIDRTMIHLIDLKDREEIALIDQKFDDKRDMVLLDDKSPVVLLLEDREALYGFNVN